MAIRKDLIEDDAEYMGKAFPTFGIFTSNQSEG